MSSLSVAPPYQGDRNTNEANSVIGLAIGQLVEIQRAHRTADKTWQRATQSIWEMTVVFASVLCAVVPRSQQFWGDLQSGGLRAHRINEYELSSGAGYKLSGSGKLSGRPARQSLSHPVRLGGNRSSSSKHDATLESTRRVGGRPMRTSEDSQRRLFSDWQAPLGKTDTTIQAQTYPTTGFARDGGSDPDLDNAIHQTVEFTLQRG